MDAEQKYIEEKKYDVDDQFLDALQEFELPISLRIARFIESNNIKVETNNAIFVILELPLSLHFH